MAWLRFEGDEQTIVGKHRAYFEQGYTTFDLASLTKDFVQPTSEVFVLTDSSGARATNEKFGCQGEEETQKV